MRRATCHHMSKNAAIGISIHALLAESDCAFYALGVCPPISIHALLAESDQGQTGRSGRRDISIHALLAESDEASRDGNETARKFLSTLSLRRATYRPNRCGPSQTDFYPRSPCGERPPPTERTLLLFWISIHALLAESDPQIKMMGAPVDNFYPRSPCGERL